ncbi:hypothetical protein Angca_001883, partial [Angiostrongylus cantonensis]
RRRTSARALRDSRQTTSSAESTTLMQRKRVHARDCGHHTHSSERENRIRLNSAIRAF